MPNNQFKYLYKWKLAAATQQASMCPMNDIFTTPEAELLFAVSSHAAIIFLGGLRLRVRVSVGVMVRVSKLLGSNYNPNPNPNFVP